MPARRKTDEGTEYAESWDVLVERQIKEAQDAGAFDRLTGAGRPLPDEINPFEGDRALINSILKNNDAAPPWIDMGKEAEAARTELEQRLEGARLRMESAHHRVRRLPPYKRVYELPELMALRASLRADFARAVDTVNHRIDLYNLAAPFAWLHKLRLLRDEQLARFDRTVRPADDISRE